MRCACASKPKRASARSKPSVSSSTISESNNSKRSNARACTRASWLRSRGRAEEHPLWITQLLIGAGAVYGTFFGAGLGVVMLAVLGLLVADDLQRLNALKGVLSLVINAVGAAIFVVTGHVDWLAAALLAAGAFGGATLGVTLARRLPPNGIRAGVVVAGVTVAIVLLVRG